MFTNRELTLSKARMLLGRGKEKEEGEGEGEKDLRNATVQKRKDNFRWFRVYAFVRFWFPINEISFGDFDKRVLTWFDQEFRLCFSISKQMVFCRNI